MNLYIDGFNDLVNLFHAPKLVNVIVEAIQLGLFDVIGVEILKPSDISNRLNIDQERISYLLKVMNMIGLIEKFEDGYKNSNLALEYITNIRRNSMRKFLQYILTDSSEESSEKNTQLMLDAMDEGNKYTACYIARLLRTNEKCSLLDIGCGSGIFSKYMLKYCKQVVSYCVDLPHVIDCIKEDLLTEYGNDRIHFIAGDFRKISFEIKFDMVFLNNILHFFCKEDIKDIIINCKKCLNSNGIITICDNFSDFSDISNMLLSLEWYDAKRIFLSTDEMTDLMENFGYRVNIYSSRGTEKILVCRS